MARVLLILIMLMTMAAGAQVRAQTVAPSPLVLLLDVSGPIGPPAADYIAAGLATAQSRGAALVILQMDTPGGLVSSTRDIVSAILASPVPVAVHVAPAGARAASAGTYILYASHVSAMAPGTTVGAATPVSLGGAPGLPASPSAPDADTPPAPEAEEPAATGPGQEGAAPPRAPSEGGDAMTAKSINDAEAYLRSLADLRGRSRSFAVAAVREAATLTARDAASQGVADHLAADTDALILAADGRRVETARGQRTLSLRGAVVEQVTPSLRLRFLAAITDPNILFVLMTLGVYGIIFELSSPGTIFPGLVGALCLLTGVYGLNIIPLDSYGLVLVALGIGLMTAEAFVPSFGILGIGGVLCFTLGGFVLLDTDVPGYGLNPWLLAVTGLMGSAVAVAFAVAAWQSRLGESGSAEPHLADMVGARGHVEQWYGTHGRLVIDGRYWMAKGPRDLVPGSSVAITGLDGERLVAEASVAAPSLDKGQPTKGPKASA